ncbi:hypothetical protein [Mesorhizobium sp. SP-1A]|uniref:hypothetical protein n=1 Tax=Mesorhizobium sp. SP-1A TaxID=3077840 RepID=UPI0028F6D369|nr:hypothetical protein [Mesorhizobium sp. SP-1A]
MTTERTPFYKRTLDSFADHIITRQRQRKDGNWHAVLDCSFDDQVSDPDFSPYGYGATREQAAERCAHAIRQDAIGIGKFAPHSVLKDGYDLHFRLMRHWEKKERLEAAGVDLVEATSRAHDAFAVWNLNGEWLNKVKQTRTFDFDVQLAIAEMMVQLREYASLDPDEAKIKAVTEFKAKFANEVGWRVRATDETWAELDRQFDEAIQTLDYLAAPGW